jgi:hypothetical protein
MGTRSVRAGKGGAFPHPARKGDGPEHAGMPGNSGRGHRPCHSATLTSRQPGAQSPRPAPAPPPAGASRPPGRALASVGAGGMGLCGSVPRGRGKRMRFPFPPEEGADDLNPNRQHRCHGRGHRPCHVATLTPGPPGAKVPGQRPPRPRRALLARRVGRWPLLVRVARVLVAAFRTGGGNAVRFRVPPEEGADDLNPNRQRRCHGRGHRPCHVATLTPGPPGAQSPRPPPRPRRALLARRVGRWPAVRLDQPIYGEPSCTGGETQCVSFSRPHRRKPCHRCHGRGHRPCHSATLILGQPGAQSPRPAPAPPSAGASRPPGRALASVSAGGDGLRGSVLHGRGNAVRFLFPPGGAVFPTMPGCPVSLAGAIAPATAPR